MARNRFRTLIRYANGTPNYRETSKWYAAAYGINVSLFYKMIGQESGWRALGCNYAGACGIAQIIPRYHPGVNVYDPLDALDYSAWYYRVNLLNYGCSWAKALTIYNAGGGNLQAAIRKGGAGWQYYLPSETKLYIKIIIGRFPGEVIECPKPIDAGRYNRVVRGQPEPAPAPVPAPAPPAPPEPAPPPGKPAVIPAEPQPEPFLKLTGSDLLDDLAWLFFNIRGHFRTWAESLRDVWLLGEHLRASLDKAADFFRDMALNVWRFEDAVKLWLVVLNGVLNGTVLNNVLEAFIWNWKLLRNDAGLWVRAHIEYMYPGWSQLITDPGAYIAFQLKEELAEVGEFLEDSTAWLRSKLTAGFPVLAAFAADPDGYIVGTLKALHPFLAEFLADPAGYIARQVQVDVFAVIEANIDRLVSLGERILIQVWDG